MIKGSFEDYVVCRLTAIVILIEISFLLRCGISSFHLLLICSNCVIIILLIVKLYQRRATNLRLCSLENWVIEIREARALL